MSFKKITIYFFCLFFSIKAYGASFSFPTTLTADTTGFVLVSNSGTTPEVSGFSTDVFVVITGTAGKIKILTFAESWDINSKILRKINKDSGHENTFMLDASLAF